MRSETAKSVKQFALHRGGTPSNFAGWDLQMCFHSMNRLRTRHCPEPKFAHLANAGDSERADKTGPVMLARTRADGTSSGAAQNRLRGQTSPRSCLVDRIFQGD